MSVLIPAVNSSGLQRTANLSNPASCTKLIWCKFGGQPTSYTPIMSTFNSAITAYEELYGNTNLHIHSQTADATFSAQPTWTDWNIYAWSATTVGAGSLIGYFQDNAQMSLTSKATTGAAVTVASDRIGTGGNNQTMTIAYYMEWNVVLTPTQLETQFASPTPVVALSNLVCYLALNNSASAGTDTSAAYGGTGPNNFTAVGTLSNGTSLPVFGITHSLSPVSVALAIEPATFTIGGSGTTSYYHPMAPAAFYSDIAPSYSDLELDSTPLSVALSIAPVTFSYSGAPAFLLDRIAVSLGIKPAVFSLGTEINPVGLIPEEPYVIAMPLRNFTVSL